MKKISFPLQQTPLLHLTERTEFSGALQSRMNDAVKANLFSHLPNDPESPLAKLAIELELPDLVKIKALTLWELAKQLLPKAGVGGEVLDKEIAQYLDALPEDRTIGEILQLEQPVGENPLFTDIVRNRRLQDILALTPLQAQQERIERFKSVLDQSGGLHTGFWKVLAEQEIASREEIQDIQLTFELVALTQENLDLVNVLKARNLASLRDLIPMERAGWLNLLRGNEIVPPGFDQGEPSLRAYAAQLEASVADAYPTEMFFTRLLAQDTGAYAEYLAHAEGFLRANPGIALEQEISFEKIKWHTKDRKKRAQVKQSIDNLRKTANLYRHLGLTGIINDPQRNPAAKVEAMKAEIANLDVFLHLNPGLDLHHADFHQGYFTAPSETGEPAQQISWGGIVAEGRAKIRKQLLTYQRVFRIHPYFKTAQILLENELDSARKIILMTEELFVKRFVELSNPNEEIARAIFNKALGVAENAALQWINVKEMIASPAWQKQQSNNTSKSLQQYYQSFQSYQDMFGSLNFFECEDCQSIFGPAAYFVDLMRFTDLNITQFDGFPAEFALTKRRPDLWQIPLDCANTKTLVSYLDIVNEIIEKHIRSAAKKEPYKALKDALHPLTLPFNLPLEEIRVYLSHFKKNLSDLYEAFGADETRIACEYLRISPEDQAVMTTYGLSQQELAKRYGIAANQLLSPDGLARVKTFLRHSGLTRKELSDLLFQDLSESENAANIQARFFINNVNDGHGPLAIMMDTETDPFGNKVQFERIADSPATAFSERKLNSIHRFIRLAKRLDWSFADLDWVLWSLGGGQYPVNIDDPSLKIISKIKKWRDQYDLPLDVLCSFWYLIKDIGKGDTPDTAPRDLFDRLFNHPDILKGRLPYNLANPVTWHLDQAADENRNRLLAALEITDDDLNRIARQLTNSQTLVLDHTNLSQLYRFSKIPKVLNLSVQSFIDLLSLMRGEGLLAQVGIASVKDFEKLVKIADWLQSSGFDSFELSYVLNGKLNPFVETGYSDSDVRLLTEDLGRELNKVLLQSAAFLTIDGVNEKRAVEIYNTLKNNGYLAEKVIEGRTGSRLTDKFKPDSPAFSLGLATLVPPGQNLAAFEKKIINILLLRQDVEKKIALKRLGVLFGIEPDILQSIIAFASRKLETPALLTLLSTPVADGQSIPAEIDSFLRAVHCRLFIARKLELTKSEIDSIAKNTGHYNIGAINTLKIKDIESIQIFKQFTRVFNDTTDALIAYFRIPDGPNGRQQKIAGLSKLTDWDEYELKLLFDKFWPVPNTDYSDVAAVRKIKKCFDTSLYMGVGIKPLLQWLKDSNDYTGTAKSVLEIFKAKYNEAEWKKKFEPLADRIRSKKRDALSAFAIWNLDSNWPGGVAPMENLRDLYAYLLIDVEMTSCAKTSRIAQGIASLQLYIQRCQMNLELGIKPERVPAKQWEWMINYRVWEANRKVFLYPENYIEPELRDDKSPIFKELEDELLQSEVNTQAAEKAYRNYMNKFSELANLKTAGGYHDTGTDTLYLFGHTNTQPYIYYYRTYEKHTTWTPWVKVNLNIKSEYVSPIFAFNRLFVFWVELSTTKESAIKAGNSQDPVEKFKATIKYSFYDFNKNWVAPQTLSAFGNDNANTIYKPAEIYWNRVFPVNIPGNIINIRYGGAHVPKPQGYYYGGIQAGEGTGLEKDLSKTIGSSRPVYSELFTLNIDKENLTIVQISDEIDNDNYYLETSYPVSRRPSKILTNIKPPLLAPPSLFGKTFKQPRVLSVNNDNIPDQYIFDSGEEQFLIKTPFRHKNFVIEWNSEDKTLFSFERISSGIALNLSEGLLEGGVDQLLSIVSQQLSEIPFIFYGPWNIGWKQSPFSMPHLDWEGASGHYYWEVFFHTPFLVADHLNADQKFEDAQKWYHYIYNPTIQQPEKGEILNDPKDIIWRFLPFRDLTLPTLRDMLNNPAALEEYHKNPFKPHAIARLRPTAYQKAIVLKYIDNLLDWGDYLFAQDTSEAINEATMLYVTAYNLLGPRPEKLGAFKPKKSLTFSEVEAQYKKGSLIPEFLIELENSTVTAGAGNGVPALNNDFCFYFCVPENDQLLDYWDRVEKSLYKIRHCMNIKGIVRDLALFAPPINPMALVQAAAAGRDIASVLTEVMRPVPPYRFIFMLEKAKSFCGTVQQLGSALLSAIEKKDTEELALLRSTHEKNILQLTTAVREKQRNEAIESHAALLESKAGAMTRNRHYKNLIDKGLSKFEQTHLASMIMAWFFEQQANMLNNMASIGYAVPQAGSPFAMTYGGREIGAALTAIANAIRTHASSFTLSSSMNSTLGGHERRRQDWTLQEQISQHDVDQIGRQIAAAEIRKQITEQELTVHEKNIEQTDKVHEFMRDKFSSKDLYNWMKGQLSGLYFQTYKMAYDLAKSAERAFQYERDTDEVFIHFGHWDSLKQGLLAGEKLMLELNQLEKTYLDDNTRLFEIEKTISLAYLNPKALLDLKTKGVCEFEFSSKLFDLDFPGHYCRKIKTIAITIPAVAGPYENIKATLTQTSHKTLVQPDSGAFAKIGGKVTPELDAGKPNFVRSNWISNQQIAISRGLNDSGMFELNFRDERYLPFEGSGAVSDWKLEMPKAANRIDFDSISDVIIHLKYTSRFDGALRDAILPILKSVEGYRIFSVKHDFSNAWHRFLNPEKNKAEHELVFNISENLFPPNATNYQIQSVFLKVDFEPEQLAPSVGLKLTIVPGKAKNIDLEFNTSDISEEKGITNGSALGEWVVKVARKDGIPVELQRKKGGIAEFETVGPDKCYFLDPEKVRNIGLIVIFTCNLEWN